MGAGITCYILKLLPELDSCGFPPKAWSQIWLPLRHPRLPAGVRLGFTTWKMVNFICFHIFSHIWVNYNISLTWIKAIWGWFPLLTMIPVRSQWGRYNLPRHMTYLWKYVKTCENNPETPQEKVGSCWVPGVSIFQSQQIAADRDPNTLQGWK